MGSQGQRFGREIPCETVAVHLYRVIRVIIYRVSILRIIIRMNINIHERCRVIRVIRVIRVTKVGLGCHKRDYYHIFNVICPIVAVDLSEPE